MKNYLQVKASKASSIAEGAISLLIIAATIIAGANLFYYFKDLIIAVFTQTHPELKFDELFSFAIQLVIAVEFVKMLTTHTAASAVEVLLVVVAKRVIVDEMNMTDTLLGIIAFAILFMVRKYLNSALSTDIFDAVTISCDTTIKQLKKLTGLKLAAAEGLTLGEYIKGEFKRLGTLPCEGSCINTDEAVFTIKETENGEIKKLEVTKK